MLKKYCEMGIFCGLRYRALAPAGLLKEDALINIAFEL
jgi:hypothetical protein